MHAIEKIIRHIHSLNNEHRSSDTYYRRKPHYVETKQHEAQEHAFLDAVSAEGTASKREMQVQPHPWGTQALLGTALNTASSQTPSAPQILTVGLSSPRPRGKRCTLIFLFTVHKKHLSSLPPKRNPDFTGSDKN